MAGAGSPPALLGSGVLEKVFRVSIEKATGATGEMVKFHRQEGSTPG